MDDAGSVALQVLGPEDQQVTLGGQDLDLYVLIQGVGEGQVLAFGWSGERCEQQGQGQGPARGRPSVRTDRREHAELRAKVYRNHQD